MTGNDINRFDVLAINIVYATVTFPVWMSAYLFIWIGNLGEFLFGDIRFAVPNVAEGVGARPRHTPGTLRSHVLRSSVKQVWLVPEKLIDVPLVFFSRARNAGYPQDLAKMRTESFHAYLRQKLMQFVGALLTVLPLLPSQLKYLPVAPR